MSCTAIHLHLHTSACPLIPDVQDSTNHSDQRNLVTSSNNVRRVWSQRMPGRVLSPLCAELCTRYKTNFTSLKPVLAFQTLTLAILGKWATTHERVFSLGKNCSWTFLPGSTWLWTPITRLRYISCLRSFRTHFDSLKRVDDLRVYQGFMMPLNHQAGIQGTLKQCLRS